MGVREGCSPGFWGNKQHLTYWKDTCYRPKDIFNTVFDRNVFDPTTTLLQAINPEPPVTLLIQLARQTVAALLNASHPNVHYSLTTSQVITMFQQAFDSREYEETKNKFEIYNQLFCPLGCKTKYSTKKLN